MTQPDTFRTDAHENGFVKDTVEHVSWTDLALIAVVPALLLGFFVLPRTTLANLVFDTAAPELLPAFVSYFVHFEAVHLVGSLTVYLPVIGLAYLLSILSNRRQTFRRRFIVLLFAAPVALSSMHLVVPGKRMIFGFSGINAVFFALASFEVTGYLRTNVTPRAEEEYAPSVLLFVLGLSALVALPADALRFEIGVTSLMLAVIYVGIVCNRQGLPSRDEVRVATDRPGYFETAGAALGLIVGYPFVAFQEAMLPGKDVVNLYVHLLAISLVFILLFAAAFSRE